MSYTPQYIWCTCSLQKWVSFETAGQEMLLAGVKDLVICRDKCGYKSCHEKTHIFLKDWLLVLLTLELFSLDTGSILFYCRCVKIKWIYSITCFLHWTVCPSYLRDGFFQQYWKWLVCEARTVWKQSHFFPQMHFTPILSCHKIIENMNLWALYWLRIWPKFWTTNYIDKGRC